MIRLPDDCKEYLAIYTTEYEDTYLLETILADDIFALKDLVKNQQERILVATFNYDMVDEKSDIYETERIVKLRKLNKKIGDNLKLLYNYRCQICGKNIGEEYGSQIVEAHHIDYFVHSLTRRNRLTGCHLLSFRVGSRFLCGTTSSAEYSEGQYRTWNYTRAISKVSIF